MDKPELEALKQRLNPDTKAVRGVPAGRLVGVVVLPPAVKDGEPVAYEIIVHLKTSEYTVRSPPGCDEKTKAAQILRTDFATLAEMTYDHGEIIPIKSYMELKKGDFRGGWSPGTHLISSFQDGTHRALEFATFVKTLLKMRDDAMRDSGDDQEA